MKVSKARGRLIGGASALVIALTGFAAPAMAQEAAETPPNQSADTAPADVPDDAQVEDEAIVVTGLRAALRSAQQIKQNADQFVDSVTAVDIGRLPDVNIAEALQRISGVQITRNYGEGSGIAVRGLTQVRSELNGRDIFSANGGRGLSWEEVGADLLAGVDVYKNPSADLIEGGLSGTINLRTRMPFDQAGRLISGSASFTHFDLADDNGYSLSGVVSDRWDTPMGEFGLLANVSYQETAFRQDMIVVEPYRLRSDVPGFEGQSVFAPQGGGVKSGFGDRQRLSIAGGAQWKPTPELEFYAQFLQADYDYQDSGTSFFIYDDPMPITPGSTWTVEDGIATSGSFRNGRVDSVTFAGDRSTMTRDISFGAKWEATDRLRLSTDLQFLKSKADQFVSNMTISALNPRTMPIDDPDVPGPGPDYGSDWDFIFDNRGDVPDFTTDPAGYLADINNYGFTAILPYAEDNDAKGLAWRGDLEWEFGDDGFFQELRAGVRYTDKDAINRNTTYNTWAGIGGACSDWGGAAGCYRASEFPDRVELNPANEDFMRGDHSNVIGPHWQWRLDDVRNIQGVFDFLNAAPFNMNIGYRPFDDPGAVTGDIAESTYAAYGRLDFAAPIGGMDLDGNIGVRVVKTESSATGFQTITYRDPDFVIDPANPQTPPNIVLRTPADGDMSYTNVLPSLNLRLKLTPQLQLRFAASKNAARPNFSQLNSAINISPTYTGSDATPTTADPTRPVGPDNPYIGTGEARGSPLLKPEKVTQVDAAIEYYFASVGFVYATAFYKKIEDLLVEQSGFETYNLEGLGDVRFSMLRLQNVDEGSVKGFEVGGQRFFDFLPAPFDGLGVQANYTYVDSNAGVIAASEITGGETISVPLVNLSKDSFNLVGMYEKYGFNVRVAYNWRGDFLQGTRNTGTGNLPIFGDSYGILDASVSYDINENIAVTLDAQNLLNSAFRTYQLHEERLRDYVIDDRRFTARIRFKL